MGKIADELKMKGFVTLRGKDRLNEQTISVILRNELYKGDQRIQKQPPKDLLTKKPDYSKEYTSYYVEDSHEAIVSKELWDKVQQYLVSPIKKKFYLQEPIDIGLIGSYSALSHYSMLASEDVPTKVITKEQLKDIEQSGYRMLPFEDVQCVQVWKYPPLVTDEQYIDKLSVYLTLKDDRDPRVEKELEIMINNMSW